MICCSSAWDLTARIKQRRFPLPPIPPGMFPFRAVPRGRIVMHATVFINACSSCRLQPRNTHI